MVLNVRRAAEGDAADAVDLLRRSISELCSQDHGDDPKKIAEWLENKRAETWQLWVNQASYYVYVAERYGFVCGVGMVRSDGEILLNYVHPEARFCGVSTILLATMEAEALSRGVDRCFLESTQTAKDFYLARGYLPICGGGGRYRLAKTLSSGASR